MILNMSSKSIIYNTTNKSSIYETNKKIIWWDQLNVATFSGSISCFDLTQFNILMYIYNNIFK